MKLIINYKNNTNEIIECKYYQQNKYIITFYSKIWLGLISTWVKRDIVKESILNIIDVTKDTIIYDIYAKTDSEKDIEQDILDFIAKNNEVSISELAKYFQITVQRVCPIVEKLYINGKLNRTCKRRIYYYSI